VTGLSGDGNAGANCSSDGRSVDC